MSTNFLDYVVLCISPIKYLSCGFLDDRSDPESETVMAELEKIDDECDSKDISFVKIDDLAEAKEYGIDDVPALVYFENGIPALYEGDAPF